ncbi:MAG: hypothetical protein MI754_12665 [Chromatiales bacterium]|nr:hypothetical protein [Chromatiales bacterium]
MKAKRSIYALLATLLLAAAMSSPLYAASEVKSGLEMNEGPYNIFNQDLERSS